ncbi:unnamed protein product [Leptidea sinapis]|uniref:Uncharacterized protein n=1 Tax=Leptidea sinapis TaxID=189913 RepID=A0A5E4QB16_9NEOP|nr:unnamed protein product [Leptidea sinapis]
MDTEQFIEIEIKKEIEQEESESFNPTEHCSEDSHLNKDNVQYELFIKQDKRRNTKNNQKKK